MTVNALVRAASVLVVLVGSAGWSGAAEFDPVAAVDALQTIARNPPGFRPSHAKGICAVGRFEPTPDAAGFSKAAHFKAGVPALARLSVAGGNPQASDKGRTARGLAVALTLPDGAEHHLVMLSVPVFIVDDPANFVPFIEARLPDPATGKPDPERIKAFSAQHPETTRQAEYLAQAPVPASYATSPFFGINTFVFIDEAAQRRPARWVFEPVAGRAGLSAEQLGNGPDEFLADELRQRLGRGAVEWDVFLQIPTADDPLDDPTVAWPDSRERVRVARLSLTAADGPGEQGACQAMMFDPLLLPDGIEPSDDPVLLVRSAAYAESLTRRSQP